MRRKKRVVIINRTADSPGLSPASGVRSFHACLRLFGEIFAERGA